VRVVFGALAGFSICEFKEVHGLGLGMGSPRYLSSVRVVFPSC
jgi:hypothetical protein